MFSNIDLALASKLQTGLRNYLALAAGPDGRTMPLDGALMGLASEIGLSHEVLYRTLAELEKEGLVSRSGSEIAFR